MTTIKAIGLVIAGVIVGLLISAVSIALVNSEKVSGTYAQTERNFTDANISDDLVLTQVPWCVNFYATSTATQNKLTASSTATIEGIDGVIMLGYGSCQ